MPEPKVALVAHDGVALADIQLQPPLTFLLGSEREGFPRTSSRVSEGVDPDSRSCRVAQRGRRRRDRALRALAAFVAADSSGAAERATM